MTFRVLDPTPEKAPPIGQLAPRLAALEGKTIALMFEKPSLRTHLSFAVAVRELGGDVVVVNKKDVSTKDLPARFSMSDEWYNLVPFPTNVRFLATIDESSWKPVPPRAGFGEGRPPGPPGGPPRAPQLPSVVGSNPGHGTFHPVAWCQYYDGGRSWVTSLGHDAKIFTKDDAQLSGASSLQKLLVGGIQSAMGMKPFCQ